MPALRRRDGGLTAVRRHAANTYAGLCCALGYTAVVWADLTLKAWCAANIRGADDRPLWPGVLRLTYTENRGAAFSIFQDARWFFVWLGAAVVIGLLALVRFDRRLRGSRIALASLTLMLAGTTGNLLDRLFRGYVIDMFLTEFVRFAIFNIADIALTVGGAAFCGLVLFSGMYKQRGAKTEPANGVKPANKKPQAPEGPGP